MEVGFIGLGNMGQAMARNLIKAGHRVTVYNRSRAKAEALKAEGAIVADRIAAACGGEIVITMLADDPALEAVMMAHDGALHALKPGATHISMSTISVALSERLTAAHEKAGQRYVAAPVLGRPEAAAARRLFILAAGAADDVARCTPLFEAMGQRVFTLADKPATANLVKLSVNFLIAASIESLGEAFALARKAGVDAQAYGEMLAGSLFGGAVHKTYGGIIAAERYEPVGFSMRLGLKDIREALAAADKLEVPLPIASLLHDKMLAGVAEGDGDKEWSTLARRSAQAAGLKH